MSHLPRESGGITEPHWLAKLLRLTPSWSLEWDADGRLLLVQGDGTRAFHAIDLSAEVVRGWFFSRLKLQHSGKPTWLTGLTFPNASALIGEVVHFRKRAIRRLGRDLAIDLKELQPIAALLRRALAADRYLAATERSEITQIVLEQQERISACDARITSKHALLFPEVTEALKAFVPELVLFSKGPGVVLGERNAAFVQEEWHRWKPFFDTCERTPLTDEQGKASITMEEATLLVAAAGSGKTSTVVGKVAYMLAKGLAKPGEILCLAFNSGAAGEIGERLKERLTFIVSDACPLDEHFKAGIRRAISSGEDVASKTFHAFGRSVIRRAEGTKPPVIQGGALKKLLADVIQDCRRDASFAQKWWLLQTVYRFAEPSESRFQSEAEYEEYLRAVRRERSQAEGISTMGTTHPVRSLEEAAISNWLYLQGVQFEYEAHFAQGAEVLCPGKAWRPDFCYRIGGDGAESNTVIVHEHFAINDQGKAPPFFDDPEGYVRQAESKQRVLRGLDGRHFWTTSAEYRDGTLFERLHARLVKLGVAFDPPSEEQKLRRLQEIGLSVDDELLERAVSQIRANEWTYSDLAPRIAEQREPARATLFLELAVEVAARLDEVMAAKGLLDFDGMIRRAIGYLRSNPGLSPYRVILADEFQDTAAGRAKLIREALKTKPDARLFAVGDDWQAINRFAGSDISLFTGFGEAFGRRPGGHARCDLTETFRTNQGIADVSTSFVLKNTSQLPKSVKARDEAWKGVIDIRTYRRDAEVVSFVDDQIQRWVQAHARDENPSVLLLGRNKPTYLKGIDDVQVAQLMEKWSGRVNFVNDKYGKPALFHSMHGSKGRQADYVLILGMHRVEYDFFCFPSEREEDPLLQLVLPDKESLIDAEERRLFYVALTRAKHQVMLLAQVQYPSPYVLELLRDHREGRVLFNGQMSLPEICPKCEKSFLVERVNGRTQEKFLGCGGWRKSRSSCDFTKEAVRVPAALCPLDRED